MFRTSLPEALPVSSDSATDTNETPRRWNCSSRTAKSRTELGFLEATYLDGDSESPNQVGLSLGAGGSLVLTGALRFGGVLAWGVAQVVFGGPGWQAPACLSPSPENAASFFNSVAPGQVFTFMGFGIGPDIGAIYQPGPQGQAPLSLDDPLQQPTASSPERLDQVMWITPVESSMFPRSFGMTSLYVLFPVVSR